MKKAYLIAAVILISMQYSFGQFVHTHIHINNTDTKTRAKLAQLIITLGARNGTLGAINGQLATALASHKTQLLKQYTRNRFDYSNGFIASAIGSSALSLGASTISSYPSLPYMTDAKKEYIRATTMDKALLLALQVISKSKIKSSKRQEIYRLRSKLLREFSKNDRDARQSIYLPVAGLVVKDYDDFTELYKTLKLLEIFM